MERKILKFILTKRVYFQALPHEQVVAVHVDNGFMRKNESQEVEESLKRLGLRLKGSYKLHLVNITRFKKWSACPTSRNL